MIISQLTGGLGNQMFQYAFGFNLAKKHRTIHRLHFISHKSNTPRHFELNNLRISNKMATMPELNRVGIPQSKLSILFEKLRLKRSHIINEDESSYQLLTDELPEKSYIQGYWQSEKFFIDSASELRKEFSFKKKLLGKNILLASQIQQCNAIAVHIRRGDYVTNINASKYHGTCTIEYYKKGIQLIQSRISNPIFYYFSDDPEWTKNNLGSNTNDCYIDWNQGEDSYIDMQLISLCKHSIIANSSFSWWGAWLNSNRSKLIVAPRKWYEDQSVDSSRIIPQSWIKI
jgi:hypothetical protein